jgi:pimeloyl-ACP methyl ester carboxylesterase
MTHESLHVRRLVALPGMDGTGRLLRSFAEAIGDRLDTELVGYPPESFSYKTLSARVEKLLEVEREDYVLLAESFSGPIALSIAQRPPAGLRGLVLVVTFAAPPDTLLLELTKLLPTELILSANVPCWMACSLMLNDDAPEVARQSFCEVIREVSPGAVSRRLREVRKLEPPTERVHLPVLYIQSTDDRILPASAVEGVRRLVPSLEVFRLPGGHLVLSESPQRCADRVVEFVSTLK